MNFDDAFNPKTQTTDIEGIIIKDHYGEPQVAYTGIIQASRPLETELYAPPQE